MLLQYDETADPLRNEHNGFCFQCSEKFKIATVAKRNERARYKRQHQRQIPLMATNQHWRNLSAEAKANWTYFAAEFPEPTKTNPGVFLSGYQLFCKRQQYVFLNGGIAEPWMLAPIAPELDEVTVGAKIKYEKHCLDVTQLYIYNFGLLPKAGQYLMLKILPYSTKGGKFYPVYQQTVKVDEVYIDGLFVALSFPSSTKGVTFSVYLSYPVSKNNLYQSSKIRYMGCFTVKSFLDLSDTPDSYEGQAGKIVSVKDDESGLEFTEPGGGGLTCADLVNCPTIINIIDQIKALQSTVSATDNTAIPPVNFGLHYNYHVLQDVRNIAPIGWHVMTMTELDALRSYLGGNSVAGGKLKETGLTWWNSPNNGATNEVFFNLRGCSDRSDTGTFGALKSQFRLWVLPQLNATYGQGAVCINSDTYLNNNIAPKQTGRSIILVKDTTSLSNGGKSVVTGNNGRVYRTICIKNSEYIADPLCETKFRNGDQIPEITANAAWAAATTPALCAHDNNWTNV